MTDNIFESNKERYQLNITITSDDGDSFVLRTENIELYEYTNEINTLVNRGTLKYIDIDGIIDRFLDQQYVYCNVSLSRLEQVTAGNIVINQEFDKTTISFFVDNIGILENNKNCITYKLFLTSINNFDIYKNVEYSNYGYDGEYIISAVRNILDRTNLKIDEDSFNINNSTAKIKYITSGNDDIQSSITYLFNKLNYDSERYGSDESLKGIIYDEFNNNYHLFDINTINNYQKSVPVTINAVRNDSEVLEESPVNIAYVVRKRKTDVIRSTIQTKIYDYNFDQNIISSHTISSEKIKDYFSGGNKNKRPKNQVIKEDYKYLKKQMTWNNNIDFYGQQFSNLIDNQSMVVNIFGKNGIIPGFIINVAVQITREQKSNGSTSVDKEESERYKKMNGSWIASKINYLISPRKKSFRQNISLIRNEKI